MVDRTSYWEMLTPPEVRRASLWAVGGAVLVFAVGPLLASHWKLMSDLVRTSGFMIVAWNFVRIFAGAPGWRVGQPGEYDERETIEHHRAMAISYIIVVGLIVLGMVSAMVGRWFDLGSLSFAELPAGVSNIIIFGLMALPGIVLAWRNKSIENAADDDL